MNALTALSLPPTAPTAPVCWGIPLADQEEFIRVVKNPKARREITLTLKALESVHAERSSANFVAATDRLAIGFRHVRGMSGPSLRRKYYAMRDGGWNWRVLVKGYQAPAHQPEEFQEFLRGLIEANPRSATAQIRKLLDEIWPSGAHVPGYGNWRSWFALNFPDMPVPNSFPRVWPDGWTVSNLRRYGPTKAERKFFTGGLAAAHRHLPVVKRDPSKLRAMEWIVIDDFELDKQCVFEGDQERGIKPQIAYVAGLMAMCVGTRKKLAWMLGPMVKREEKQKDGSIKTITSNLRAGDVQALLYKIFSEHGLPDYPVKVICENASASISAELELMLSTVFEGRITVERTSLVRHKTLSNGFVERGGTPWEKGWIESEFNYLWNQVSDGGKGYKGSNERLNAPGWLNDQRRYSLKFLGQGPGKLNLPPELIGMLQLPFLSFNELEESFAFVIARSEMRTKHRIQGFDTVTEFIWQGDRNETMALPEGVDPQAPNTFGALALLDESQRELMKPVPRKECPLERWERLTIANPRQGLSVDVLSVFLLSPKLATCRNQGASFTHQGNGYSYLDDDGVLAGVIEGTKILLYVDFNRPAACLATRENGEPLGTLRLLGDSHRGVDITDPEAMDEARRRRRDIVKRVIAQVQNRHEDENAQMGAERAYNEKIKSRWEAETANLPIAARIAAAQGEVAGRMAEKQRTDKALDRSVKRAAAKLTPQDASDFLDDEPTTEQPVESKETLTDYT